MSKSGDDKLDRASSRVKMGAVVRGAGKASVQLLDDFGASDMIENFVGGIVGVYSDSRDFCPIMSSL
jgi:hypothetical protein